jgi:hypothetical protein
VIKKIFLLSVFFVLLSSCVVHRAVIKQDYNFAAVKTVCVGNFADAQYENSGVAVQSSFVKALMARGFNVVTGNKIKADVLIEGSLTTFQPDKKYLVRMPQYERRHRRHNIVYDNDIVEIGGSSMYDLGTAFGLGENNRIMVSNATVGINAYMVDTKTGEIVWSDSYTYEGLDLTAALNGAVRYIVRTIPMDNIIPANAVSEAK